ANGGQGARENRGIAEWLGEHHARQRDGRLPHDQLGGTLISSWEVKAKRLRRIIWHGYLWNMRMCRFGGHWLRGGGGWGLIDFECGRDIKKPACGRLLKDERGLFLANRTHL